MSNTDKIIIAACVAMLAFYFLRMTNQPVPVNPAGIEQLVDQADSGVTPSVGREPRATDTAGAITVPAAP